jgi:ADP-ribose pyrophosphatase YjhB (NUDIX family)
MKRGIEHIGIAVVTICHDSKGNYLLGQRSDKCRDEHMRWDLIGSGGVEFGEKLEDTLNREVREEIGADVKGFEYLGFREVLREHDGKLGHWIAFDFKVEVDRSQVVNAEPEKCLELGWFKLGDFPQPMHSQLPIFLEQHKDKL